MLTQMLLLLLFVIIVTAYGIYRALFQGKLPELRKIAALEALDEGVGRALEMGAKVLYGMIEFSGAGSYLRIESLIGIPMVTSFASKAAKASVGAVYTTMIPQMAAVMEGVVRDTYAIEGRTDLADNVDLTQYRVLPPPIYFYALVLPDVMKEENVKFAVFSGNASVMSPVIGMTCLEQDALSIAAYPSLSYMCVSIVAYDYAMLLQENFVAGASIKGDKAQLGSITGQDMVSWLFIALVLIMTVLHTAGISIADILLGGPW